MDGYPWKALHALKEGIKKGYCGTNGDKAVRKKAISKSGFFPGQRRQGLPGPGPGFHGIKPTEVKLGLWALFLEVSGLHRAGTITQTCPRFPTKKRRSIKMEAAFCIFGALNQTLKNQVI